MKKKKGMPKPRKVWSINPKSRVVPNKKEELKSNFHKCVEPSYFTEEE